MEEERKAKRLALVLSDDDFCGRVIGEESRAQSVFSGDAGISETLVCRQILYEFENERNVGCFRAPDLNRIRQNPGPI